MAIQTTYTENIAAAVAGHIADMSEATVVSRTVESATLVFGVPVAQGTTDGDCRLFTDGDTVTQFIGVSVRDRSILEGDSYTESESAAILRDGPIWVVAAVAVDAGDPVCVTATGTWSNAPGTGGITLPKARWETSTTTTGKLAKIYL